MAIYNARVYVCVCILFYMMQKGLFVAKEQTCVNKKLFLCDVDIRE